MRRVVQVVVPFSALALIGVIGCGRSVPENEEGVSEVAPGPAESPSVVIRERTPGKAAARFTVEPQAIRTGHYVRFEAFGEGADGRWPRWSCVAYRDVGECFGTHGVRLPYRVEDRRLVLEIDGGPLSDLGGGGRLDDSGPVAAR